MPAVLQIQGKLPRLSPRYLLCCRTKTVFLLLLKNWRRRFWLQQPATGLQRELKCQKCQEASNHKGFKALRDSPLQGVAGKNPIFLFLISFIENYCKYLQHPATCNKRSVYMMYTRPPFAAALYVGTARGWQRQRLAG